MHSDKQIHMCMHTCRHTLTKSNNGFSNQLALMLDNGHLTMWVDLGDVPHGLVLEMDVNVLHGNVEDSDNQAHTLGRERDSSQNPCAET